jgi:sulfite exporter TauE/SafE
MTALVIAILASSLVGSFHCAGMCGVFVALAVTPVRVEGNSGAGGQSAAPLATRSAMLLQYNLGRLLAYAVLGSLAGLLGSAVDLGASLAGVQRMAAIGAATISFAFGLSLVARSLGRRMWSVPVPNILRSAAHAAFRAADRLPLGTRPLAIGLATGLLPCGWLWVFVATAAGTANAGHGAIVMTAFWLGTLPVMVALGAGVQKFFGAAGSRLPLTAAVALVVVSGATIVVRTLSPCAMHPAIAHVGHATEVCIPND